MNKAEQSEAISKLRETFKAGDTVCTILRHVSRSGMSRSISVLDHENNDISWLVARALGMRFDRDNGGVKINGCGMDMGFAIVYDLSRTLFVGGFECIGEDMRCPSNDHSNGDRNYSPDHNHKDGGYALRHRWI